MIDWTHVEPPKYTRDDVEYETWYSDWQKTLARNHTRDELFRLLGRAGAETHAASARHHSAVSATSSMESQSQRRAHARNVVAASGDTAIAIRGAIEIHALFPEHAKRDDS